MSFVVGRFTGRRTGADPIVRCPDRCETSEDEIGPWATSEATAKRPSTFQTLRSF